MAFDPTSVSLDRSRAFGDVYPPHEGAYFYQDGFYFDNDGKIVEALLTAADIERAEAMADAVEKLKAAQAAYDAALESGAPANFSPTLAKKPDHGSDDVDIVAWAAGSAQYPFFKVKKFVQERYNVSGATKDALIKQLQDIGVLS